MDVLTLGVIVVITVVCGWLPPLGLLFLERRLARQTLEKAEEIRKDAYALRDHYDRRLTVIDSDIEDRLIELQRDMRMRLAGEREQIFDRVQAVENGMIFKLGEVSRELEWTPEREQALLDKIGERVRKTFEGKMAAEVKAATDEVMQDPATVEVLQASYEEQRPDFASVIMNNIGKAVVSRVSKWGEG